MPYTELSPSLAFNEVDTHNLLTLGLADISIYPATFTVVNPTYSITPPGFPVVQVPYTKSSVNIYNSNNLNITCVTDVRLLAFLPDGIWKIQQSIAPVLEYLNEKTFLRVSRMKHEFGLAFMKVEMGCDTWVKEDKMKYLHQIYAYIEGAIAAANQCNNVLAMDLYRIADRTLKNFMREHLVEIETRTNWG